MAQLPHLLTPESINSKVREWLAEDIPSFDYGGAVVGDKLEEVLVALYLITTYLLYYKLKAQLLGKAEGVLAGVPFFTEIFHQLGCRYDFHSHAHALEISKINSLLV